MENKCKTKILIGNHGSGKSKYIYDYFYLNATKEVKGLRCLDLNKKLYLVVPEQDTAEKQKIIMERFSDFGYGMLNVDVISFDRMAHMVFSILDIEPKKEKIIGDDVKSILLKKCLISVDKKKKLKYFSKIKDSIGFTKKLTSCMSEFYSYNITSDKIVNVVKNIENDLLKSKLLELSYIYEEFRKELKNKEFIIKEDKLNLLLENIHKVDIFNDAIIAFDGFTGFVPLQKSIFDKLMDVASEILVAVDYRLEDDFDEKTFGTDLKINDLFYLSKEFVNLIVDISASKNIKIEYLKFDTKKEYKFIGRDDLRYLEQNIFKYKKNRENIIEPNNIVIYKSGNALEEVKSLTHIIEKLIREENYNYSDIKVIVPDIEKYRNMIMDECKKSEIPLFIDDSENIYTSPYIETIRAAFEVLLYRFSYDSVLRYINSGLFEKNEDLYELDNFIRKYGIRGYLRYKSGFEKIKKVSNNILEIKNDILKPLVDFYESLSNAKYYKIIVKHTIYDYIESLKKFIKDIKLDERYKKFIDNINDNHNLLMKDVLILEKSYEVLNETIENLMLLNDDKEVLSIDDVKNLIDIGFENVKVKSIPFSMDQIVVGDLMRSRFDNPKVCILMGFNQSEVPKNTVDLNLIDDEIRDIFSKENIELSQTSKETALNQRFYLYLALTSAKEKIILSSSGKNVFGESDEDAYIIDDIKKMFSNEVLDDRGSINYTTKIKTLNEVFDTIFTKKEAFGFIVNNYKSLEYFLSNDEKNISDDILLSAYITIKLIKCLKGIDSAIDFNEYLKDILNIDFRYNESKLNSDLLSDLLKSKDTKDLYMSSSSIEEFNSCPYKYFLDKTLELKERENFEINSIDIGNLFHKALEYFFVNNNCDIKKISDEDLLKAINNSADMAFSYYDKFKIFDKDEKDFFGANELVFLKNRLKTILETTIKIIRQDAKISELKSFKTEEKFNYVISDNEKISGKIDKIDTLLDDNNLYIKIIDYKSSNKRLKIKDVEFGVEIQLMLYLDYLIDNAKEKYNIDSKINVIPCGAYYLVVEDNKITIDLYSNYENRKNLIYENKDISGIFNSEKEVFKKIFSDNSELSGSKIIINSEELTGKAEGIVLDSDKLNECRNSLKAKILDTIQEIKEGNIKIKPYEDKVCKHCPFTDMCKKEFNVEDDEDKE